MNDDEAIPSLLDNILALTMYGEGEVEVRRVKTWSNKLQKHTGKRHYSVHFHGTDGKQRFGLGRTFRAALEDAIAHERARRRGDKDWVGYSPADDDSP